MANAQGLYDSELKQYLRTYYISYDVGTNNNQVIDGYLSAINERNGGPSSFLQESFRGFAESSERNGYDVYEAFSCPGFWVRRSIDGTADEFHQLLTMIMKTFDEQFLEGQTEPTRARRIKRD